MLWHVSLLLGLLVLLGVWGFPPCSVLLGGSHCFFLNDFFLSFPYELLTPSKLLRF
jgi:hypothetical protein